jgi:hypothetical protein
MARPSDINLTVEVEIDGEPRTMPITDAICLFLTGGVPILHAAQACGISEATYHAWRSRGRTEQERIDTGQEPLAEEQPFAEFLEQTNKARSRAVSTYALELRKQALAGDTAAIRFFLSHSDRDNWFPKSRTDIASEGDIEVRLTWGDD